MRDYFVLNWISVKYKVSPCTFWSSSVGTEQTVYGSTICPASAELKYEFPGCLKWDI